MSSIHPPALSLFTEYYECNSGEQFWLLNCIAVIIRPQKIKVSNVCVCVCIIYCNLTIGYVINYDHTMVTVRVVIRVFWWILIILVVVGDGGGGGSNFVNPTRKTIVRNTTQPKPLSTSFIMTQFFIIIIILAPLQSETKYFKKYLHLVIILLYL